jgi:SAM-dependent methyltransferase
MMSILDFLKRSWKRWMQTRQGRTGLAEGMGLLRRDGAAQGSAAWTSGAGPGQWGAWTAADQRAPLPGSLGGGPPLPGAGERDLAQIPTVRLLRPAAIRPQLTRRYLIDSDYLLPKDLIEASRLDFQHFYLKHVLKSNYLAPINVGRVRRILDVGCGTGRWVLEMARAFPQARVYGIDLEWSTPLQKLPPNVTFQQGNVLEGLPFEADSFDYVHQRLLAMGIPADQWGRLIGELLRVTAPGGWIELLEGGDTFIKAGPALQLLSEWYREASKRAGYDPAIVDRLGNLFQRMGLRNVRLETLSVPVGPWGRHEGIMLQKNILACLPGIFPLLSQQLNIDEKKFNILLAEIEREMETMQIEYQYYIVYGQKP